MHRIINDASNHHLAANIKFQKVRLMQYTWRMELLKRVWECEASTILSLLLTHFPRRYLSSFLSVCVRQSRPSYQLSKESRHLKSIKETLHWTSAKGTINLNSLSSKLHSKAKSLLSTMHWDSINFVLRPWGITQFGKGSFFCKWGESL